MTTVYTIAETYMDGAYAREPEWQWQYTARADALAKYRRATSDVYAGHAIELWQGEVDDEYLAGIELGECYAGANTPVWYGDAAEMLDEYDPFDIGPHC